MLEDVQSVKNFAALRTYPESQHVNDKNAVIQIVSCPIIANPNRLFSRATLTNYKNYDLIDVENLAHYQLK